MVKYKELTTDLERLLWLINDNLERLCDILEKMGANQKW